MTPHQKIMRAASQGTGLRLTAEEVGKLSMDGAIEQCAANDDEADKICKTCGGTGKLNVNKVVYRWCPDCRDENGRVLNEDEDNRLPDEGGPWYPPRKN